MTGRSVRLINALTQTGTWNQSPPPPLSPAAPISCTCVCAFLTLCLQRGAECGCGAGGGADGTGAEEKKGVCSGENNRWTCSGGCEVSLITHRPHLLICSNYLPTHRAPCQRRGVNTADQIHLKSKCPPTRRRPHDPFMVALSMCGRKKGFEFVL